MALNENKRIQLLRPDLAKKRVGPADAGTYYVGQLVMAGPDSNTFKPISGSTEPGVSVVGIVMAEQTVAQGENLEVWFDCSVVGFDGILSGSGFTTAEIGKIAWSADGETVYDSQASATNPHKIGRFGGFTTQANGTVSPIFNDIGTVVSSSTF